MITFYMLRCKDEKVSEFYIGSTKDLKPRIRAHKKAYDECSQKLEGRVLYTFMKENGGFDNWEFKIVNQVVYFDEPTRRRQEQVYLDFYMPALNMVKARRSDEEKRIYQREYDRARYAANREEILQKQKEYSSLNKDKVHERRVKYYAANREKALQYSREYYRKKKELSGS